MPIFLALRDVADEIGLVNMDFVVAIHECKDSKSKIAGCRSSLAMATSLNRIDVKETVSDIRNLLIKKGA